ncbi:MAG: carboxymuconolactone decarboxylase family protein [Dehalococcoidia bacterium]
MARLPDPRPAFSPEAAAIHRRIVGARGDDVPGLYRDLMNYPELAHRFADLGALLRFEGSLPGDIRELAILATARTLRSRYIWAMHQAPAREAGLTDETLGALLVDEVAERFEGSYAHALRLVAVMLAYQPVPELLQDGLISAFGLEGFLQLAVIPNYYRMIAGLAAGFEFPLPAGMTDPFADGPAASRATIAASPGGEEDDG